MKATTRARVVLALLPIVLPLNVLWWFVGALIAGAREFGDELREAAGYTLRFWYRDVYRPARYGHVLDDPDYVARGSGS